jgi:hypothetical protein
MTPRCGCSTLHDRPPELAASLGILDQCAAFLAAITPDAYASPCAFIAGSTIGQHVRHLLDHFDAVAASFDSRLIDYDHRERDTPVERDPAAARERLRAITRRLASITPADLDAPVRVRVMLSADGRCAECSSSLARELAFAGHHAVHHHAMIAAIAAEQGLPVPTGFGKAPSTLLHEIQGAART